MLVFIVITIKLKNDVKYYLNSKIVLKAKEKRDWIKMEQSFSKWKH